VKPTARSFVLDLLSTLRRGTMPVAALVEAAALFDIPENSVRVALTRLLGAGRIERDERGRYRLGEEAGPVARHVTSWRRLGGRTREWNGAWVTVLEGAAGTRAERPARRRRARALEFLGFRTLAPGISLRPDNLRGGVSGLGESLRALGLPEGDGIAELRNLDAASDARARELWDVAGLERSYRGLTDELRRSRNRLKTLANPEAMVESFLLGGRALRQLVFDPLLPEAIAPAEARAELLETMRDYDVLGRTAWAEFLTRYDVPHRETPADTRMAEDRRLAV
jgi:phenylacetic acid degradation operon negative regulatory protein